MARRGAAWRAVVLVLAACTGDPDTVTTSTAALDGDDETLQDVVDTYAAASPGVPGIAVAVLRSTGAVVAAAGEGGPDEPLEPGRPFRIASNTKTFTAAATLRLVEDGVLGLDDPIAELVDPALLDLLVADGYDTSAITVRQLLGHTSGLHDYASEVDFQVLVLGDPSKRWTRLDQVRFATDEGDPLGEPGTVHSFSDTGYILLGDIIERATGETLGAAVRDLVGFARLGLADTWWEDLEQPPPGVPDRTHQYYEAQDTYDADPSFDLYGGGGLVSTVGDLAAFSAALLGGDLFQDPATLELMTTIEPVNETSAAAMGLFRIELPGVGGCWSHSGFWGSFVATCDDGEVTVALSVFQASPDPPFAGEAFVRDAIAAAG